VIVSINKFFCIVTFLLLLRFDRVEIKMIDCHRDGRSIATTSSLQL